MEQESINTIVSFIEITGTTDEKIEKLEKEAKSVQMNLVENVLKSITDLRKKLVTNVNYKILIEVFQINIREV
mgnify:CR=1 FL=1